MTTSQTLLLRGACVIDTEPEPAARPGTDVRIVGGHIDEVGPGLSADGATVIDASDRILLPGFVDAHRHVWLTALRATTIDADLGGYLTRILGDLAPKHRPGDIHAATLLGALECLDSGITTVQDYSHAMFTPNHADAALDALRTSGIRAVLGYGAPVDSAAGHADVRRLRETELGDDTARVTLALAPAGPSYSPIEQVRADWLLARDLGLPIVVHVGAGPVTQTPIAALRREGLLTPATTYVHGNSLSDDELRLIADSGAAVAVAPAVEAQMGHGAPMPNRLRAAGVTTGLGADVVTAVAGDMFSLMRAALMASHLSPGPRLTAADVLRLATLDGARALGLGDRAGSLRPGKQADLILLRTDAPNLAPSAADPIGLVVTAAHPGNVDTVIVGGEVMKRGGVLLNPALAQARPRVEDAARRLVETAA